MAYIKKGTYEYNRASLALFLGGFITFTVLYTSQPLLPVFSKEFHVSATLSSLTLSLTTGILAVVMLVAAILSDSMGRKKVMVTAVMLTSIISFMTAFSPTFSILLFLRSVMGIFVAGIPSIAMAYIVEEFEPKGLGYIMGLYISGNIVGGMFGRIVTGILTDLFTWRIALGSIGIFTILLGIVFYLSLPDSKNQIKRSYSLKNALASYRSHLTNWKLIALLLMIFVLNGGFVTVYNYIGYHLMEPPYLLSEGLIAFIFLVYIMGSISSFTMGQLADRFGRASMIVLSMCIMLTGLLFTIFTSLIVKIIGLAIFTFGFFATHSISTSWVGERALTNRAQATSLYLFFYYTGSSVIGTLGGLFWTRFNWLGVVSFIFISIMLGFVFFFLSKDKNQASSSTTE